MSTKSTERHDNHIDPPSSAFAPPNPTDPRGAITLTSNPAPSHPTLTANKIAAIENMGATQNQFDAIDLSDNEIVKLEGFPPLSRLHTLYLSNNRIARVGADLSQQIPMLKALYLTNNRLKNLADLDPLKSCKRLTHLSLLGNPVSKNPDYRLYAVYSLPALKVLDFRKVKQAEREADLDMRALEDVEVSEPSELSAASAKATAAIALLDSQKAKIREELQARRQLILLLAASVERQNEQVRRAWPPSARARMRPGATSRPSAPSANGDARRVAVRAT